MLSPAQFLKIAPYLHNYFVLVGFIVFVVTGIWYAILKASHLSQLSGSQKLSLLVPILKYAFWLGIVSILSGLAYTGYHEYKTSGQGQVQIGPVQQQTGSCGVNVDGNNNSTSVDCSDKASFVELDTVTLLKDYSTLKAGAELKFNAFYVQHGPEPLHNVYGFTSTLFIKDPKLDADSIARSMFQQSLDKFKAERASKNIKGADLAIGQAQWTTVSIPFSDQSGVDAVQDGRIRLYIFGWETWTDMEERTSDKMFCRWLQKPSSITLLPEDVIWHSCIFN